MNHNIKTVFEERYKTFDDRILWNLPIFYNSESKIYAFFVVDSHSYNKDGTINEDSINSVIYYNTYPNEEELKFIDGVDDGKIDKDSYIYNQSYSDLKERIRVHDLMKKYTNDHPLSLRPYDTLETYLKDKVKEEYEKFHTLEMEILHKKEEIAYDRWKDECRGLRYKGAIIYTDEVSQNKIMAAAVYANTINDPNYVCRWKCHNGTFIDLNQADLNELGNLMREHVQACYNQEEKTLIKVDQCKDKDMLKEIYYEEVHEDLIGED